MSFSLKKGVFSPQPPRRNRAECAFTRAAKTALIKDTRGMWHYDDDNGDDDEFDDTSI